jgi:hypothetical protein
VFVPAGRYRLKPHPGKDALPFTRVRHHLAVSGRRNVHLRGVGDESVLLFDSAEHQGLRFVDVADCSVRDVRPELADQPPLRRNRALLEFSAARNCVVAGVTAVRSSGPGIRIDSSRLIRVTGSEVRQAGTYGIELAATRQAYVDGCTVVDSRDNAIESSWVGSISREPQFVRISDNRVLGTSEGAGVGLVGGDRVEVIGNRLENTYLPGIYVYDRCSHFPAKRLVLSGNQLSAVNTGQLTYAPGAIALHGLTKGRTSADVTISRNVVSGTPHAGVWVGGPTPVSTVYSNLDRLVISHNTFIDVGTVDISIDDQQRSRIAVLVIE